MTTTAMPDETYPWDEVRARLQEEADRGYPASWQPEEPGDELFGVMVGFQPAAPTRLYGPAPVVEIETPEGARWSLWLLHKVLRLHFERQRIEIGERVLVRYLGKVKPEGPGNAYDNYAVIVDRPGRGGSPDWEAVARRYGDADELRAPSSEDDPPLAGDPDFGSEADDIPF